MEFIQIDVTGCRVTGVMTVAGNLGPKHHGVLLGRSPLDGLVYIAELVNAGYQICTFDEFKFRYQQNGSISIEPLEDPESGIDNANRALGEIAEGKKSKYNLLLNNNCESFVYRSMNRGSSSVQVTTAIGALVLVASVWILVINRR